MGGLIPGTDDFEAWLLRQLGTPEFVVVVIGTLLAVVSWWAAAKFLGRLVGEVGDRLAVAAMPTSGQRAAGVLTLVLAGAGVPLLVMSVLKVGETYGRYISARISRPTFDLPFFLETLQDWSADNWILQIGAFAVVAVAVYLVADLGRLGIAKFLLFVVGFPLAGAFWLIGFASAAMAGGFTILSFARVEGATLESVPVHLGTLAIAIAGWWSLMRLDVGWEPILPVRRTLRR